MGLSLSNSVSIPRVTATHLQVFPTVSRIYRSREKVVLSLDFRHGAGFDIVGTTARSTYRVVLQYNIALVFSTVRAVLEMNDNDNNNARITTTPNYLLSFLLFN